MRQKLEEIRNHCEEVARHKDNNFVTIETLLLIKELADCIETVESRRSREGASGHGY